MTLIRLTMLTQYKHWYILRLSSCYCKSIQSLKTKRTNTQTIYIHYLKQSIFTILTEFFFWFFFGSHLHFTITSEFHLNQQRFLWDNWHRHCCLLTLVWPWIKSWSLRFVSKCSVWKYLSSDHFWTKSVSNIWMHANVQLFFNAVSRIVVISFECTDPTPKWSPDVQLELIQYHINFQP